MEPTNARQKYDLSSVRARCTTMSVLFIPLLYRHRVLPEGFQRVKRNRNLDNRDEGFASARVRGPARED